MTWRMPRNQRRHDATGTETAPHWPEDHTPAATRVLVEHPERIAQGHLERGLRERGYEVLTCGGPEAAGPVRTQCPILAGESCPGVEGADVIVSSLHLGGAQEGLLVQRLAENLSGPPMILEASGWQVETAFGRADTVAHHYPFTSIDDVATAIEGLVGLHSP